MPMLISNDLKQIGGIISCLLIIACAPQPINQSVNSGANDTSIDFSGSWELDYRRSDDVNRELKSLFRKLQRAAENRASNRDPRFRQNSSINIGGSNPVASVVAAARLADTITRSPVLEIDQSGNQIEVKRGDSFALTCEFHGDTPQLIENALGTEVCGWDHHQLVFKIALPDNLTISHRMTIAPDGQKLHVATTVASSSALTPFTLSRIYDRFEPLSSDDNCEYTLSRGKSCTASH